MKIKENINGASKMHETFFEKEKKASGNVGTAFKEHLRDFDNHAHKERIQLLVSQIEEQGEKLSKKVDVRELKIYKRLISDFIDEALNNSHQFSRDSHLDRRGRYKVYATVKKINKELEELTEQVLISEKDNIKILQKIEDIRGLVLDLKL
ncbi:MAG: YaaR family protein [Clostridium sp.]|nr:YaaR family protein [Clostridium sp.]